MAKAEHLLAVNTGSSSVKFAVFGPDLARRLHGTLEGIGINPVLKVSAAVGAPARAVDWHGPDTDDVPHLIRRIIGWITERLDGGGLAAIGHRIAVGGTDYDGPVVVTDAVLEKLRALQPLAPLHLPRSLEAIAALAATHGRIPQVACFDTAFHRTMPPLAQLYALPRELAQAGARRYGFHGLSYEYVAGRLPAIDAGAASGRTIVCHLGSGASLCALKAGKSVATTMGFSPLSGLVMGTRAGDLDPGLIIWLIRDRGMSVDEVERMLYHDAGLRGFSGLSADMRTLLASADPRAGEAVDLFVNRIVVEIGSLAATLGGLDALVFTGGIGERSPEIRAAVCAGSAWLGVGLDEARNRAGETKIGAPASAVSVLMVPTDEERVMAMHTARLVFGKAGAAE
ncbi:MAG: acetate/propionate family kinase [Rhizobiaceae bacterium]